MSNDILNVQGKHLQQQRFLTNFRLTRYLLYRQTMDIHI